MAALGAAAALLLSPVLATSASAAPAAPTALSPADTSVHKDAVLTWAAVPGATSYQVQMSATGDFDNNQVSLPNSGNTPTNSFELPVLLPHATYEWRVRAIDGSGASAWAGPVDLTRGWNAAPVTTSTPGNDQKFSWNPIADASMYELQLASSPTFNDPPETVNSSDYVTTCMTLHTTFVPYTSETSGDTNVPSCEIDYTKLGSTFFWRVRGIDTTSSSAPSSTTTPEVGCAGVFHEAGTPASDTAGECSLWSQDATATQPNVPAAAGDYHTFAGPTQLCVNTTCGNGSQVQAAPAGSLVDGGTVSHSPTFSWSTIPNTGGNVASQYRVTLALDAQFSNVQRYYITPFRSLVPRDELMAGRDYYVSVQGCDDQTPAHCGAISWMKFHVAHNAVTGLSQSRVANGEQLSWSDYQPTGGGSDLEAKEYRVQVTHAGDDSYASPVLTNVVDRQGETAGVAQHFVQVGDGSYIWRVQAIDGSSDNLPWSLSGGFTIDTTPPVFALASTATLPVTGGQFHFSATEATGTVNNVSAATLHPFSLTTRAAVPGTLQNTGFLTWTFVPSAPLTVGDSYGLFASPSITDPSGNSATAAGGSERVTTTADDKSAAWHFSSGWTRHSSSNAIGKTFMRAATAHSATVQAVTSKVSVYGCKGPNFAKLTIQVDGHTKTTAKEHQSFSKCGVLLWSGTVPSGLHTVRVVTTGGTGTVDAVRVS